MLFFIRVAETRYPPSSSPLHAAEISAAHFMELFSLPSSFLRGNFSTDRRVASRRCDGGKRERGGKKEEGETSLRVSREC